MYDDEASLPAEGASTPAAAEPEPSSPPNLEIDGSKSDELRQRRSATHSKLRAYEAKRRVAYESKLQSSSLYWHAFRTLMHDSLLETQKADILMRGWTHASKTYGSSMMSVGEWHIDEKGVPITDAKKKKKLLEANEKVSVGSGVASGVDSAALMCSTQPRDFLALFYHREETCGSIIERLADSAVTVARKYEGMAEYMKEEIIPELSLLLDHLKSEIIFMEKLGNSIMSELETAEDEACRAWDLYYNRNLDFSDSSSETAKDQLEGSHDLPDIAVKGCGDVWVEEMRYRMAVAFLSSVWEKCSSELSKIFLTVKDTECNRRHQIKGLMSNAATRQESLWLDLPLVINPILKELTEWPMERNLLEGDVQFSIRERAQSIQRDEAEHKKADDDVKSHAPGLDGVYEADGNFELSSPLVSDLMCKAKVVEKRSHGMMSSWKVSLAIITCDSFLQLFELPPTCKLQSGSAPEVAFQNLIPPVVVPSMEGVKGGVKFPSAKNWLDHLEPSESFALLNCAVSHKDEKNSTSFEIVETFLASGASKMFTKTANRKMQFRAVTPEEAKDFVDMLKNAK